MEENISPYPLEFFLTFPLFKQAGQKQIPTTTTPFTKGEVRTL